MKGMGQVAAGNTGLIQQGHILISEMESLPKQNLLPRFLPAASAWQRWISSHRNCNKAKMKPTPEVPQILADQYLTNLADSGQCSHPLFFSLGHPACKFNYCWTKTWSLKPGCIVLHKLCKTVGSLWKGAWRLDGFRLQLIQQVTGQPCDCCSFIEKTA